MEIRLEASKKGVVKPYLAKLLPGGKREFAKKFKISNTRNGFGLKAEVGDIIDGRGSVWSGNGSDYVGGYFCGLVTSQGVITIDRTIAEFILKEKLDGWVATGMWAVDDGQNAVRIGNDEPLGSTPLPGEGDCSGIILERDGEIRLVEDFELHYQAGDNDYDGHQFYIAPIDGGFAKCDLAPRLRQLSVFDV